MENYKEILRQRLVENAEQAAPVPTPPRAELTRAANFLHKTLGPLTLDRGPDGKLLTDSPSHYYAALHSVLKPDPYYRNNSYKEIAQAAHEHIISGHHGIGDVIYRDFHDRTGGMDYTELPGDHAQKLEADAEVHVAEKLESHLRATKPYVPPRKIDTDADHYDRMRDLYGPDYWKNRKRRLGRY